VDSVREVARVVLPTQFGEFEARAFEVSSGLVYLGLVKGEVVGGAAVLTRLHSECLTGDVLGSLRCDCGVQLRLSLRRIAIEERGLLIYVTGHEGRGVGLVNKLRAYIEQDGGADTLDANVLLGLPIDGRRYDDAAAVLRAIGVGSVRLLTNNPEKARGLREAGVTVERMEPLQTAAHHRYVGLPAHQEAAIEPRRSCRRGPGR
jgi:3,4-dihydroxy 2-butanone 4-phosphate synthase/GTP cyclohydrolase II